MDQIASPFGLILCRIIQSLCTALYECKFYTCVHSCILYAHKFTCLCTDICARLCIMCTYRVVAVYRFICVNL